MTQDTRIALFLLGELIAAIRANKPEIFKAWLCGGRASSRGASGLGTAAELAPGSEPLNLSHCNAFVPL